MNCGIVTFYDHSNCGAVLQAYALQQALDNMGFDGFHISFGQKKPEIQTQGMHPFFKNMVLQGKKRDALFEAFRKKYIKEKSFSSEITDSTDCFITGSDQVWNPEITRGNPAYFLQFADPAKRMSYGASFGKELKDEYKEIYRNGVKNIPFLSVRENSAAGFINELCSRKAETVVDPVFLLKAKEWEKLIDEKSIDEKSDEDYLLLIMVQNDVGLLEEAKKEAAEKGLSLKMITASYFPPVGYESWSGTGPSDFLRLIHNSKKVITSSFHGLAFSLIFGKPYRIVRLFGELEGNNLRFDDICKRFGLPEEWDESSCSFKENISRESSKSLGWLRNAVLNVKEGILPSDYAQDIASSIGPELIKSALLQCTGCTACAAACGAGAIKMVRGEDGFSYPYFDMEKCALCGRCSEVCLNIGGHDKANLFEQKFCAFKAENEIRMKSTSGGAFAAIAKELSPEMKIYAVTMDDSHKVLYDVIKNENDISRFTKTCYVEAEVGNVFESIAELLSNKKSVVFVGNPCKVAGLLKYIGGEHPLLTTIDHICNGVPSPGDWERYVEKLEEKGNISDYNFRAKVRPNSAHSVTYVQNNEEHTALFNEDAWSIDYSKGLNLRNACYSCKYASVNRVSDLTLGDFWGIEKSYPEFDDGYGVSLLIINSEKGQRIAEKIRKHGKEFFVTREEAMQPRLQTPPQGRIERKHY